MDGAALPRDMMFVHIPRCSGVSSGVSSSVQPLRPWNGGSAAPAGFWDSLFPFWPRWCRALCGTGAGPRVPIEQMLELSPSQGRALAQGPHFRGAFGGLGVSSVANGQEVNGGAIISLVSSFLPGICSLGTSVRQQRGDGDGFAELVPGLAHEASEPAEPMGSSRARDQIREMAFEEQTCTEQQISGPDWQLAKAETSCGAGLAPPKRWVATAPPWAASPCPPTPGLGYKVPREQP